MLSKETFCKALRMIQEQRGVDRKFSEALELVGNGHFVFGSPNLYLDAALLVLSEASGDQYEYIEWWLFESTKNKVVKDAAGSKEWNLTTPELLYDYLADEVNGFKPQ